VENVVNKNAKRTKGYLKLVYLGFLLLLISSVACGTKETNISDEAKESIKERIRNGESVGIVVGFIDPQGNREYFSYGTLTKNGDEPVDENSVYEIGSITKVFTCIALADMVLKGELSLDDPAETYLPETVKMPSRNGNKITLGHLAANNSGLPRMPYNFRPKDPNNPYADYTVENMYNFLSAYTLQRNVGETYEYSNLGMGLLGHILSLKAGLDYEQLIVERICHVLGMEDTVITTTADMKERLAKGHNPVGEVPNWDIPTLAGAGALRSTASDMLTFLGANMRIEISRLSPAMVMTHEPCIEAGKTMSVGLGWHIRGNGKTQIVWHNGGTGGYRSFCGFIKDKKIGVVVLSNMNISADDIGFHLLDSTYELKINGSGRRG
jgi:D-alanyl-D-alanine-carboxypeptidase/D-alanyl-D-alanine-endopeptidase